MSATIRKILVGTDLSAQSWCALDHALEWARWCKATVRLAHWFEDPFLLMQASYRVHGEVTPAVQEYVEDIKAEALATMKQAVDERGGGVELEVHTAPNVPQAMLAHASAIQADLIVLGTHGRSGIRRWWMGSTAERVVQVSPVPVLTVHSRSRLPQREDPVLLPVDLSDNSWQALPMAVAYAKAFKSRIHILSVVEDPWYLTHLGVGDHITPILREVEPVVLKHLEERLEEERARCEGVDVELEVVRATSPPHQIIDWTKERSVGLVALTTRGLSDLPRILMGSTAQRVVRLSETPVLTLRIPETEDEESAQE